MWLCCPKSCRPIAEKVCKHRQYIGSGSVTRSECAPPGWVCLGHTLGAFRIASHIWENPVSFAEENRHISMWDESSGCRFPFDVLKFDEPSWNTYCSPPRLVQWSIWDGGIFQDRPWVSLFCRYRGTHAAIFTLLIKCYRGVYSRHILILPWYPHQGTGHFADDIWYVTSIFVPGCVE